MQLHVPLTLRMQLHGGDGGRHLDLPPVRLPPRLASEPGVQVIPLEAWDDVAVALREECDRLRVGIQYEGGLGRPSVEQGLEPANESGTWTIYEFPEHFPDGTTSLSTVLCNLSATGHALRNSFTFRVGDSRLTLVALDEPMGTAMSQDHLFPGSKITVREFFRQAAAHLEEIESARAAKR